ncbi:MAG TPA: hypothetical protein DGD08_08610 [Gemmatimonas aurantiaca]|uniref:Uncharacterized protein n=2 Tax=Gemmatimonas aurantiaca TaxID=173480 RepID=C1A430_GEMAT|nr:hypothetical protein [Gemmatimonas aurantiaca]BAH38855.1 hypothetical protein GAU_1813 [Gemmatimonas aurantiaca T-27]HCT57260.1 hypothetical protein [Gemmatimonas aurantiaca]
MKDRLLLKDATTYRVRTLDGKEHVADWDDAHRQFLKPYEKRQRGPAIIPFDLIGAVTTHRRGRPRWYPLDDCYRAATVARTPSTRSNAA